MELDESAWRQKLGDERYAVCREGATEAPFSGAYWNHYEDGCYRCAACSALLFDSAHQYDSGSGWPSFDRALGRSVDEQVDHRYGMRRLEIVCAACRSHLGHVFEDGPATTGRRFCVNSRSLVFEGRPSKQEPS